MGAEFRAAAEQGPSARLASDLGEHVKTRLTALTLTASHHSSLYSNK
jgi:hypothetical protein